jgi:multiple sugar transport system permease protein
MADTTAEQARVVALRLARARRRRRWGEVIAGYALVSPAILYILVLVAYPFFLALYFSLSNVTVAGGYGGFVGLANYLSIIHNPVFIKALENSLSFTFFAEIGKAVLGIGLAFLLLQTLRGKKIIRGFLLIPFTMPLPLALLGWKWMYDPQFSVINRVFGDMLHIMHHPYPVWLGDPIFSWFAILIVNIWRGFPFAAVIVLAGLTSIPKDILDAAKVDGAGFFRTWHFVIVPLIAPILFIGLIYDVTFTLGDITVVNILTSGGPDNSTEILPQLAYQNGIVGGNLASGAADALILFPLLLAGLILFLRMLFRRTAVE